MKKKLIAALASLSLLLLPATASASSYNGTNVSPNADGQTYNITASAGDTLNLLNVCNSGTAAVTFNSSVSGTMQFVPSSTTPSGTTAPSGHVFNFCNVALNGFTDSNISNGTWSFSVPRSFVNNLGLQPNNVVMEHFVNGAWQNLTTTQGTPDSVNFNFTATTPTGFSPFAIVVSSGLANTGFPYALTALVSTGAIVVIAGSFLLTRKKAHEQ